MILIIIVIVASINGFISGAEAAAGTSRPLGVSCERTSLKRCNFSLPSSPVGPCALSPSSQLPGQAQPLLSAAEAPCAPLGTETQWSLMTSDQHPPLLPPSPKKPQNPARRRCSHSLSLLERGLYSSTSSILYTFVFFSVFPLEYCTADTKSQGRKIQTGIFNQNKIIWSNEQNEMSVDGFNYSTNNINKASLSHCET